VPCVTCGLVDVAVAARLAEVDEVTATRTPTAIKAVDLRSQVLEVREGVMRRMIVGDSSSV